MIAPPMLFVLLLVGCAKVSSTGFEARASQNVNKLAMSDALIARLDDQGISVKASSVDAKVSSQVAVSTARDGFSSIVSDAEATPSLVSFTDTERGKVLSDGSIDPRYQDQHAWAVAFSDVHLTHPGPGGSNGSNSDAAVTTTSTLVVFIDADTGEYLEAMGLDGV